MILYVLTSKLPGGHAFYGLVPIILKMNDKGVVPVPLKEPEPKGLVKVTLLEETTH
jgi:hypothetical protein